MPSTIDSIRIEKLILADHKRRIERLEEQVKDLRDLLAIK
jgi:archaellum component FlaC